MKIFRKVSVLMSCLLFAFCSMLLGLSLCNSNIFLKVDNTDNHISETARAATAPANSSYWDSSSSYVDTSWSGAGTESNPWLITSAAELAGLSYTIYKNTVSSSYVEYNNYYKGKYFKQTVNIDLSKYYWQPIGVQYDRSGNYLSRYFSGNYNGDGYEVSGIFTKSGSTDAYSYQGLFGYVNDGTIKNLGITNSQINGYQYVGGIIGYLYREWHYDDSSRVYITNCYNSATITGSWYVGGLVGYADAPNANKAVSITNSYNRGIISCNNSEGSYVGGIVGFCFEAELNYCYNTGRISGGNYGTGGIVGSGSSYRSFLSIYNSFNVGTVSGSGYVGAIAANGTAVNCYSKTSSGTTGSGVANGTIISSLDTTTYAKNSSWLSNSSNWNNGGWDFTNTWEIRYGQNEFYPMLKSAIIAVTFNGNGGYISGSSSTTRYYHNGDTYGTMPTPARTGYTHSGWVRSQVGVSTTVTSSTVVSSSWTTLTAQWKVKTYNIMIDYNKGSSPSSAGSVNYGAIYTFPTTTKDGYYLTGWKCSKNSITYTSSSITMPDFGDDGSWVLFQAQWENNTYPAVKFDYAGGLVGNSSSLSENLYYGQEYTFPCPTRVGYKLTSWTCSHSSDSFICDSSGNLVKTIPNLGTNGTRDIEFTAQWTGVPYTVYFNANGGTGSMPSQELNYGADKSLNTNSFTRTGYTFAGWATSSSGSVVFANGENLKDDESKPLEKRKVLNIISSEPYTTYETTLNLYAVWTPKTFKIRFNGNECTSGSMTEQLLTYDSPMSLNTNEFEKEGFLFKYWTTSSGGGDVYYQNQSISTVPENIANKTDESDRVFNLYAQWEKTWTANASSSLSTANSANKGTINNPYLVSSAEDLAYIAKAVQNNNTFAGKYFKQTAPINLDAYTWQPIGGNTFSTSLGKSFRGIYDGMGYPIYNLKTIDAKMGTSSGNSSYYYAGLFGYCYNAQLKNINIVSGNVLGYNFVGSVVGYAYMGSVINCKSGASVKGQQSCGLVGCGNSVKIDACYNYGDITATSMNAGGIIGYAFNSAVEVKNSFSKGEISAPNNAGGILGHSAIAGTEIISCGFNGTLKYSTNQGLIAGVMTSGAIENCFAKSLSNFNLCSAGATVASSIYEVIGTGKFYVGDTFANWVLLQDNSTYSNSTPLPKGLTWLGNTGKGGVDVDLLKNKLNYSNRNA